MVVDHIRKELIEVLDETSPNGAAQDWVDVVILALDGLTRCLVANQEDYDRVPRMTCQMIEAKQNRNEQRDWPDWRTAPADKAIEHVKVEHVKDWLLPDARVGRPPKAVIAVFSSHVTSYTAEKPSRAVIEAAIVKTVAHFPATPALEITRQLWTHVIRSVYESERFVLASPSVAISTDTHEKIIENIAARFGFDEGIVDGYLNG
jgi:hypothetical protein